MGKNQESSLKTSNQDICNRSKLRGLYTNARSLANKMGELELLMFEEDLDFVGITETWFDSSHDWMDSGIFPLSQR